MDWTRIDNLTPAGREAVAMELIRAGYTVRLVKEKIANKTVISLEYGKN